MENSSLVALVRLTCPVGVSVEEWAPARELLQLHARLDALQSRIGSAEAEIASSCNAEELRQVREQASTLEGIVKAALREAPVGNVLMHTPDKLPAIVRDLAEQVGELSGENDRLTVENDHVKAERVKALAQLADHQDAIDCRQAFESEHRALREWALKIEDQNIALRLDRERLVMVGNLMRAEIRAADDDVGLASQWDAASAVPPSEGARMYPAPDGAS